MAPNTVAAAEMQSKINELDRHLGARTCCRITERAERKGLSGMTTNLKSYLGETD